ncbi:12730_t:CDS:2, partial [Cetraspora pellucida]
PLQTIKQANPNPKSGQNCRGSEVWKVESSLCRFDLIDLEDDYYDALKSISQVSYTDTYQELSQNIVSDEKGSSSQANYLSIKNSTRASFNNHQPLRDAAKNQVKKNHEIICNIMEKQRKTKCTLSLNPGDLVKIRIPDIETEK